MALMTVAASFGAFVSWIFKGGWQVKTLQTDLEKKMDAKVEDLRDDSIEQREKMKREFGETCAAIRQDTTDFKFWSMNHFVPKDDFQNLTKNVDAIRVDLRAIEVRLGDKIDNIKIDKAQR